LVRVGHHVKVEPEMTFTELMKPVTNLHEGVEKNVRKVKVQSGHTVHTWLGRCTWSRSSRRWVVVKMQKPMDNLCEGVKNNEENTMVWSYLNIRTWWPSGTMLK